MPVIPEFRRLTQDWEFIQGQPELCRKTALPPKKRKKEKRKER
jgi:hypothetical protein